MKESTLVVAIGSNLGNRLNNIRNSISLMQEHIFLEKVQSSIVVETEAILIQDSPPDWNIRYLNVVVKGTTILDSGNVLKQLKNLEKKLGREGTYKKWSPRVVDLDILFFNDIEVSSELLTIPHHEIENRPFLLHLIALLMPGLYFKKSNQNFAELAFRGVDFNSVFGKAMVLDPKMIGIVNVTPDSFSDLKTAYLTSEVLEKIYSFYNDGATIVELGAQTTKPNARIISSEEEIHRLQVVLESINFSKCPDINLGIDTVKPQVITSFINNKYVKYITIYELDKFDDNLIKRIQKRELEIILIHNDGIPPNLNRVCAFNSSFVDKIKQWFDLNLQRLSSFNIPFNKITLDPGIGFGKSRYHNLCIINSLSAFKVKGCKLMVGHSRKGYIRCFSSTEIAERDIETLAVSDYMYQQFNVDYIRVHNISYHQRFFSGKNVLSNLSTKGMVL
jgi:2-amino-4-hydroxy-6-hydroxymethyldihydropteridine diphosphokinase/dihydropteroate synthase